MKQEVYSKTKFWCKWFTMKKITEIKEQIWEVRGKLHNLIYKLKELEKELEKKDKVNETKKKDF